MTPEERQHASKIAQIVRGWETNDGLKQLATYIGYLELPFWKRCWMHVKFFWANIRKTLD